MAALGLAWAAAGCADPYADAPAEPTRSPTAARAATSAAEPLRPQVGDAAPLAPSRLADPPIDPRVRRSPAALARAYARVGINWDWRMLGDQLERSLVLAASPLADDLRRTAQDARADESLRRDRPGSRGRAVSVTVDGHGNTRRVIVVTREKTLRDGRPTLEGARTRVYRGRMRRSNSSWRMIDWQLEP